MDNTLSVKCPKCNDLLIVHRITGEVLEVRTPLLEKSTGDRFEDALQKVKLATQEMEKKLTTALDLLLNTFGENNVRLLEPLEQLEKVYDKTQNQAAYWSVVKRIRQIKSNTAEEVPGKVKRLSI